MDAGKTNTLELLSQAGLPQFELGLDGYPLPGKVVKYYREQMKYTDRDGKEKHWTQAELAERLGLKEVMVNLMENKNQGLDSIDRRRTLATILRIPPVLLGLGSLDLIVEIATGHTPIGPPNAKKRKVSKDTIKQYQATFKVYKSLYAGGLTYTSINDIDKWVTRIQQDIEYVSAEDRNVLLRVLWDFEILCSRIHGNDLFDWGKAFEHIDNAKEIATILDDRDLQAASLYYSSSYHFRQKRLGLAKMDIEGALMYAKGALPQTKGNIYSHNACLRADDTSLSGITLVQNTFDDLEQYAGATSEIATLVFGKHNYLLDRAYTLIDIDRPAKAIELLDDAERYIEPANKRHLVFIDVMRAKCYINLKKPEYEQTVALLSSAIEDSKELRVARNIAHIENLYTKLVASSYGNSPDVIDLGLMLQELRTMTR
ncbi:MAG TPA: helix-turn-helix transcriptional regulator [Nitrososphaera sp.]|jgi:transcriptional regulator with XRE-family HTH domain